jgi:5'-3' exonuclease
MSLMLVDAAGLYFRAFHGIPTSITAPDGRPVNAIRGFLDMTATLITRRRPARYVACQDLSWRPAFRVAMLPSYKAHRALADGAEIVPDELSPQVPVLWEVLDAIGLARAGADGFEADDVMATLAAREDGPVEIVSGDRDLFGCVSERVRVLYVGRGVSKLQDLGPGEVAEKYGIPGERYADFAALRGDPSDGLPGVTGVGERTATALVNRFGTVEEIVAAAQADADGFPAGSRAKILAAAEYLAVAPDVVRVRTDADVPAVADALPAHVADPERLLDLVDRYGLESPVNRVLTAVGVQLR